MHLENPAFPEQGKAMDEIIALALKIAKQQRSEDHLQPLETIKGKLITEYAEMDEAIATKTRLDVISEVADCTYYNVQSFALDHDERDLHAVQTHVCQKSDVPIEQAYRAVLAKYRYRAANPKNIAAENEAIQQALESKNRQAYNETIDHAPWLW
jgi:hypothetical protein